MQRSASGVEDVRDAPLVAVAISETIDNRLIGTELAQLGRGPGGRTDWNRLDIRKPLRHRHTQRPRPFHENPLVWL